MGAPRGPAWAAVALAIIAGGWAMAISWLVFPDLSDNKDEAVYLLQAETLRHGQLFPPAPVPADAFMPWLGVDAGDHFVLKYTPVHAGIISVVGAVLGGNRAALGFIAAAAVLACYALGREMTKDSGQALVAAALFAASPLFLIQSATFLPYLSTLTLLMVFAATLIGGVRRESPVCLVASGFALGLAVFSRPFDALLFATPLGGWWLVDRGGLPRRRLGREARWLALGGAVPAAAMACYCRAATESFFRLPFTLTDPTDTVGFGLRRMFPEQHPIDYTPVEALRGAGRLAALTGVWVFGGFLLIAFAVVGVRRATGPARWFSLSAVTVPVGYMFFWGSYGSTEWGGPWRYGPFYWLPLLAPLAVLGATGFQRLQAVDRRVSRFAVTGMVAVSLVMVVMALSAHRPFTERGRRLFAAPRQAAGLEQALVFLPSVQGPWLLQPFAMARNASVDQRTLWALDRGSEANQALLRAFPTRRGYRVVARDGRGESVPLDGRWPTVLEAVPTSPQS